jgi:hypothetical protein
MANMSYCRFENTLSDLEDCHDALVEAGGIEEYEEDCSEYEKPCVRDLITKCEDIIRDFEGEM